VASPIGAIRLVFDDVGVLRALDFEDHEERMLQLLRLHYGAMGLQTRAAPQGVTKALEAYFAGDLEALGSIRWATAGTPFQRTVWTALTKIPPSRTCTYGELAARVGRPNAQRAVGLANGANPVGIVIPCHRVIGASGKLTGYGGGLPRKRWLLAHEGAIATQGPVVDLFSRPLKPETGTERPRHRP
jgi:methylated-DNA-[protein]-cysteine S-methyltransferase